MLATMLADVLKWLVMYTFGVVAFTAGLFVLFRNRRAPLSLSLHPPCTYPARHTPKLCAVRARASHRVCESTRRRASLGIAINRIGEDCHELDTAFQTFPEVTIGCTLRV